MDWSRYWYGQEMGWRYKVRRLRASGQFGVAQDDSSNCRRQDRTKKVPARTRRDQRVEGNRVERVEKSILMREEGCER